MKTYESIKNSSQVKEGDILVTFYPNRNELWHYYQVTEVKAHGIELQCPSKALIFVKNETLEAELEYFKRAY